MIELRKFSYNILKINESKVIILTGIGQIMCVEIFRDFFNSVHLDFILWSKIFIVGASIVVVNEIVKYILRLFKK